MTKENNVDAGETIQDLDVESSHAMQKIRSRNKRRADRGNDDFDDNSSSSSTRSKKRCVENTHPKNVTQVSCNLRSSFPEFLNSFKMLYLISFLIFLLYSN